MILLLLSFGIVLAGILPSRQIFEGNLVVTNLSFTYIGEEPNKLFLNNIRGISQLEGEGNQTLILNGRFSTPSNQALNKQLLQRNSLTIKLPHEKSQWIINPATNKQPSELKISELKLQTNTSIDSLSYKPYNRKLSLSIKSSEAAQLALELGEYPIKFTFTGYQLEELKLKDSPESLELVFQPNNPQLNLSLTKLTRLSVNLPDPRKVSSEDWLWGDLAVKNVHFEQSKQTGRNVNDEKYNSTIIKGQIRMGERELKVESNQFLLISKPGIKRLLNLEVIPPKPPQEINVQIAGETVEVSAPPEGLEVRLVGEADQIQVGLDRRFPVRSIKSSFLANFFSNDVLIAIISFFSAAVVSLLTWIVNDFLSWLSANSQSAAKP
ncbi:MAG: hypothetical protein KME31_21690 [Tolypothrix carrinoi HA7290-LM1]|nr:hypothetical protein [Tolypothrix carrinoi HA7290-LM1]